MTFPERSRLVQRVERTSQPQVRVGINWSNSLSRGLQVAIIPHLGDMITGSRPVIRGTPRIVAGPGGIAVNPIFTGGGSNDFQYSVNINAPGDRTWAVLSAITDTGNLRILYASDADSGDAFQLSSTTFTPIIDNNGGLGVSVSLTEKPTFLVARRTGTTQYGSADRTFGSGSGTGGRDLVTNLVGLGRDGGSSNTTDSKTYLVYFWNRFLSDAEVLRLVDNPWQLFAPAQRTIPLPQYKATVRRLSARPTRTSQPLGVASLSGNSAASIAFLPRAGGLTRVTRNGIQPSAKLDSTRVMTRMHGGVLTLEHIGGAYQTAFAVNEINSGRATFDTWLVTIGGTFSPNANEYMLTQNAHGLVVQQGGIKLIASSAAVINIALAPEPGETFVVQGKDANYIIWFRGVKYTSAAGQGNVIFNTGFNMPGHSIALLAAFPDTLLSDYQAHSLCANPWQLFAPQPRTYWSEVIAPTVPVKPVRTAPKIRTIQPPTEPFINRTHPLAKNLRGFLWTGHGQPRDLLNPQIPFVTAASALRVSQSGVLRYIPNTGEPGAALASVNYTGNQEIISPWKVPSTPITMLVFCGPPSTVASTSNFAGIDNGGYSLSNRYGINYRAIYCGSAFLDDGTFWLPGFQIRGLTHDGATMVGYDAGRAYNSVANTTTTLTYDPTFSILELMLTSGGNGAYWMAVWDRVLSSGEILSLQQNPWQLFAPQPRQGWLTEPAPFAVPLLSGPTATDITNTTAQPRVDVKY